MGAIARCIKSKEEEEAVVRLKIVPALAPAATLLKSRDWCCRLPRKVRATGEGHIHSRLVKSNFVVVHPKFVSVKD